jgi:hypothetical protein
MADANPIDYPAIQNTIANYCIALDTKNLDLLKDVFVEDANAVLGPHGQVKGIDGLTNAIKKA